MATCLGQFSNSSTLIPADARPFDKSTTIDGLPSFENSSQKFKIQNGQNIRLKSKFWK